MVRWCELNRNRNPLFRIAGMVYTSEVKSVADKDKIKAQNWLRSRLDRNLSSTVVCCGAKMYIFPQKKVYVCARCFKIVRIAS